MQHNLLLKQAMEIINQHTFHCVFLRICIDFKLTCFPRYISFGAIVVQINAIFMFHIERQVRNMFMSTQCR